MHVDNASIPTLISRHIDQEIRNKLELENRTGNSTRIAWPYLFQLKEKATYPQSSRQRINSPLTRQDRREDCIFAKNRL